jgi:hypothetical protein
LNASLKELTKLNIAQRNDSLMSVLIFGFGDAPARRVRAKIRHNSLNLPARAGQRMIGPWVDID